MTRKALPVVVLTLLLFTLTPNLGTTAEESFTAPPNTAGPIITDTAVPIGTGHLTIQPFWSISFQRGNFSPSWRRVTAGGDFTSFNSMLHVVYGPAENVEVYVNVRYIQNWAGGVEGPVSRAQFGGLGDLSLTLKYQLVQESERCPTVTPLVSVAFPTGHHADLNAGRLGLDDLGGGAYVFTAGFNLSKWLSPFYVYANLYYNAGTHCPPQVSHALFGPLLSPVPTRDQITLNLAGEWVLATRWVALLELYSSWGVGPLLGPRCGAPMALCGIMPGVEFLLSPRYSFEMGVAIDLAGKNTPYHYTPVVTAIATF